MMFLPKNIKISIKQIIFANKIQAGGRRALKYLIFLSITFIQNILTYITPMLYGNVIAIASIILGAFILFHFVLNIASNTKSDQPDSYSYHLGCYQSNHHFNQSSQIHNYLQNMSSTLAPLSPVAVRKWQQYGDQGLVNPNGANAIALQFKKYIVAYQNLKNLNQYEQTYNKGIKEARDDFLQCRDKFLQNEWDCKGKYNSYLQSDGQFSQIKGNLSLLINKKYEEQAKIQRLLDPPHHNSTADNQSYYKLMEQLNSQLSILWDSVKQKNQTLIGIENKQFRLSHDLTSMKNHLVECQKNKKEIQVCKSIGQQLNDLIHVIDAKELQGRIVAKQAIIQRYENALAKSMKVGLDVQQIKQKLTKNQKQLNDLIQMYNEVETASLCAGDLIKKCSDQQIKELDANITALTLDITTLQQLKKAIVEAINQGKVRIDEINEIKRKATQQYQNSLGSLQNIKQIQAKNLQLLKNYRDNINLYNEQITAMQGDINQAELNRKKTIHDLDGILKRVGQLTGCLTKKDYLLKLQSKRPRLSEQDKQLKKKAAENLIKMIRSVYV